MAAPARPASRRCRSAARAASEAAGHFGRQPVERHLGLAGLLAQRLQPGDATLELRVADDHRQRRAAAVGALQLRLEAAAAAFISILTPGTASRSASAIPRPAASAAGPPSTT